MFSRSKSAQYKPESGYRKVHHSSVDDNRYGDYDDAGVESINIDTGAVYGGALTALGLSADRLASKHMLLLTASVTKSLRTAHDKVECRAIGFPKLGRPSA